MFKHGPKALKSWKWICLCSIVPSSLPFSWHSSWDFRTEDVSWQIRLRNKQGLGYVKAERLIHWNSLNTVMVSLQSRNWSVLEGSMAVPLSFCRFYRCKILSHGKKPHVLRLILQSRLLAPFCELIYEKQHVPKVWFSHSAWRGKKLSVSARNNF